MIADPLVRNLATVGGNLAHADPANDHPATMLALRAERHCSRPAGRADNPNRRPLRRCLHHLLCSRTRS